MPLPRRVLASMGLAAIVFGAIACRASQRDDGPLRAGDTALATESIQSFMSPGDGEPPPPPIDTLSELRIETTALDSAVADTTKTDTTKTDTTATAAALTTTTSTDTVAMTLRVRYYLDEAGEHGWIAFPRDNQPPGVTVDSAARIIIHGQKIGGTGAIQITTAQGRVDIDLGQVGGAGTAIAGRCKRDERQVGACASVAFKGVRFTPSGGQASDRPAKLEVGVPARQ